MNGLGILVIGAIGVVIVIGFAGFLRAEDRRDDRLLRRRNPFPEPEHPGFSDIQRPPEIAHEPPRRSIHELPALGDAVWHQYPVTSPAAPPSPPGAGTPGTAAAAGGLPGSPPPPLPDHQPCDCPCHEDEWFPECPRCDQPPPLPEGTLWAPADTGFAKWESDTYVGGLTAIKDGAP